MSDTTSQPKTCHAAHRISTAILAVLILLGIGAYGLWDHTEHRGYFSMSLGDDFGKAAKPAKKKVVATEPAATDFAPPLPQHKPTPPAAVQQ